MINYRYLKIYNQNSKVVDIEFQIEDSLALVGESGSGKSLTLKALLNMLPSGFKSQFEREIDFEFKNGESLTFVPQNPFTALSPMTKIGEQFLSTKESAIERLKMLNLDSELLERFPPELSGGQLQRVVIAMAINPKVKLMLLDEPTTALDSKSKELILALLIRLKQEIGFKTLFVTHDIKSAKRLCKEVVIIKSGKVIESGKLEEVLTSPKSEYSKTLIESNFSERRFRE